MDVGDLIAHLRLDNTQFKKSFKQSEQHARASFGMTERAAKDSSRRMGESVEGFGRRSANASDKMAKGWWKTFGKVAVGFTIAYRAMNAFEEGLKVLLGTFVSGRQEIDDFRMAIVEVAASLQMLTEQPTTEGLEVYYKFAKGMFEKLELVAAKHISTGEDLRNAYAKLATMGIVPQTEKQLEQMARLVDLVIIQTKGLDKQRQIRTELQAFVLGEMRQGAVVARMMSQRVEGYDKLIENVEKEANVAKKTQMIFDDTGKILDAIGSVSKDIQKTHTALWTTLTAYLAKIQRLGLLQMYEDLLDVMIKIRDSIMDQNGLTDLGIKLATSYHTSWASVWSVTKGIAKVFRDILYLMSPLLMSLKGWAGLTTIILAGWEKIGAIFMMDLYNPGALLIRWNEIHEEMVKSLDDIFMTSEKMHEKYMKGMASNQEEMAKLLGELSTRQESLSDEAIKDIEKWINKVEDLEEKYLILSGILESVKGTKFTAEDLKSFKWLWKITAEWSKVLPEAQSRWMKVQIALSRVAEELRLASKRSKVFLEIDALKERFAILGKIYEELRGGGITSEQVDKAIKMEELERKRLELVKLIGEEKAAEWLLYQKALLNLRYQIDLEGKRTANYIKLAKTLTAIEYASPFDWEALIPTEVQVNTMEAYVKAAKELAAIEYAPPFDYEQWIPTNVAESFDSTESLTAIRTMYEDMKEYSIDYFDTVSELIDLQAEKYKDLGIKEVLIDKWVKDEKKKAYEKRADMHMAMSASMASDLATFFAYAAKENREYFIWSKRAAIAETIIKTIQAAQASYAWAAGWGGPIAGAIAATIAALAGYARVALISAQTYAVGGWLNTHPKGGMIREGSGTKDDVFLGATPGVNHWGMGGEQVFILNKEAVAQYGPLLEAANQGFAKGGWINRGYGILGNIWDVLTGSYDEPKIPKVKWDPAILERLQSTIEQMLGNTTALADAQKEANDQIDEWIEQLKAANAPLEAITEIEGHRAELLAQAEEEIRKDFTEPLEEIILKGTLSDVGLQLYQLNEWYEEQAKIAGELGLSLNLLDEAYELQMETIERAIQQPVEDIIAEHTLSPFEYETEKIRDWYQIQIDAWGELRDKMDPIEWAAGLAKIGEAFEFLLEDLLDSINSQVAALGKSLAEQTQQLLIQQNLTPLEQEIWKIEQAFRDTLAQIAEWSAITGEDYGDLIASALELRNAQYEALNAQQQAAYEQALAAYNSAQVATSLRGMLNSQLNAAKKIEQLLSDWKRVFESLRAQILSMQTTITNPQTARERLEIIREEIASITGGLSTTGYVSTLPMEEQALAIEKLRDLWDQYLKLGGEAYQRPSTGYQQIYAETFAELVGLQHYMKDFAIEEFDVDIEQLDVLKDIKEEIERLQAIISEIGVVPPLPPPIPPTPIVPPLPWIETGIYENYAEFFAKEIGTAIDWLIGELKLVSANTAIYTEGPLYGRPSQTYELHIYDDLWELANTIPGLLEYWTQELGPPFPSLLHGTDYVPETGIYKLHKGEQVISPGSSEFNVNVNVYESESPYATAVAVRQEMENFLHSSTGRKTIQLTANGR